MEVTTPSALGEVWGCDFESDADEFASCSTKSEENLEENVTSMYSDRLLLLSENDQGVDQSRPLLQRSGTSGSMGSDYSTNTGYLIPHLICSKHSSPVFL